MNHIQLLDDHLINKIAAGEVVERPASIVKELVENCIDAQATKIRVELVEGGRKRVLVSDNGSGMSCDDAKKSILRHATSKIKTTEDLFTLRTMGFRGEALASISSVCKFSLLTCQQGEGEGVRLELDEQGQFEILPWQSSGGTTIICDDIFYNVPVRQKFLKSASAEFGAVLEFMQAIALSYPNIDFTLVHNDKEVLRAPVYKGETPLSPERQLRARFASVMKGDAGLGMIYIESECPYGSMKALISAPGVERNVARDMYLFINGRWIKDKSLRFAVLRGYHSHLLRGKYPVVALFIEMDASLVDANVHPSKTEVRMQYASEIHAMVASAVRDGLRKGEWAASSSASLSDDVDSSLSRRVESTNHNHESRVDNIFTNTQARSGSLQTYSSQSASPREPKPPVWRDVTPEFLERESNSSSRTRIDTAEAEVFSATRGSAPGRSLFSSHHEAQSVHAIQSIPWDELCYMGSIADCYLLFSHGNRQSGARLLGLDQHAFHERVIYERLTRDSGLLKASQSLLVPEGVTLDRARLEAIRSIADQLHDNGFRLEFIDEVTIEVKAVPVILHRSDIQALMEALANYERAARPLANNVGLAHDILSTIACHSAVRAGEALGATELKSLLNEAKDVDFFHNCPHGRRVFKWWDEAQIARWFDR